jgi:hypothetical protein
VNLKHCTAALLALVFAAASSAAFAQDKGKESIAGKATAAPAAKAAKPAKATPAAPTAAKSTPAAVRKPADSSSALDHGGKAGKSNCHHGSGSDA